MQPSLRILISSLLGILIIGVSLMAFFLVFDKAMDSILSLTKTHAGKVAHASGAEVARNLALITHALKSFQNTTAIMSEGDGLYYSPSEHPDGFRAGCDAWMTRMAAVLSDTQQNANNIFCRFSDWSVLEVNNTMSQQKLKSYCARSDPAFYAANGYELFSDHMGLTIDLRTGAKTRTAGLANLPFDMKVNAFRNAIPTTINTVGTLVWLGNGFGGFNGKPRLVATNPYYNTFENMNHLNLLLTAQMRNSTDPSVGPLGWFVQTPSVFFIRRVLADSLTTPGSQAHLIDTSFLVVSSTAAEEQWLRVREATATELKDNRYPLGCSRDLLATTKVGCRQPISNLPAVSSVDPAVLTGRGIQSAVVEHEGLSYIVGSSRLDLDVDVAYWSSLNMLQVIPLNDVAGDVFTQRNINLGIVFGCFVVASVLGYVIVLKLLQPLDDVAERMQLAAKLHKQESAVEVSMIAEVGALQTAFVTMEKELMRIKGFVPQSLLMAEDDDDAEQKVGIEMNKTADNSTDREVSYIGSRRPSCETTNSHTLPGVKGPPNISATATHAADVSDAITRASQRSEGLAGGARLTVNASSLKSTRVAVAVVNLRHFNRAVKEITPELLIRLCELMASAASESAKDQRGVLDSFSGDHFIMTFNAARACPMATQRACTAVLRFAKELETTRSVKRIKELVSRTVPLLTASTTAHKSSTDLKRSDSDSSLGADASNSVGGSASVRPIVIDLLQVCAGVGSGMATVGNLGSNEIKRFSIIGEVFSRTTELEVVARERRGMPHFEPPLPYTIIITGRDADDVESAMNIEYVAFRRLKHARTFVTQAKPDGDLCTLARVLGEHGAGPGMNSAESSTNPKDNEWMYALKAATCASSKKIEVRNLMFQQLERRDVQEVRSLIEANPDVACEDVLQALKLLNFTEIGDA